MNIPLFYVTQNTADFYDNLSTVRDIPRGLAFRHKWFSRMIGGGLMVAVACLLFLQKGTNFGTTFCLPICVGALTYCAVQLLAKKQNAARLLQQLNQTADFAVLDGSAATWHGNDGSLDEYQWAHFVTCLITPHTAILLHEDRVVALILPIPPDPQLAADMLKLLREKVPNQIPPLAA